jgi:hypothetical protein
LPFVYSASSWNSNQIALNVVMSRGTGWCRSW